MGIKYTKYHKNIPRFSIARDPPKSTQIGILGLKTNHLAALKHMLQTKCH
jgi:hypothetical protein